MIEEVEEGEDKAIPKRNVEEPMDIVDPKEEAEIIAKAKQKEAIKEAEDRLK